jgi:hypothetical protein
VFAVKLKSRTSQSRNFSLFTVQFISQKFTKINSARDYSKKGKTSSEITAQIGDDMYPPCVGHCICYVFVGGHGVVGACPGHGYLGC